MKIMIETSLRNSKKQIRSFTIPALACGPGMVYEGSAPACNPTCLNPNAPEECSLPKTENCVCEDSDAVPVVDDLCVSATTCGCTGDNGTHHEVKLL